MLGSNGSWRRGLGGNGLETFSQPVLITGIASVAESFCHHCGPSGLSHPLVIHQWSSHICVAPRNVSGPVCCCNVTSSLVPLPQVSPSKHEDPLAEFDDSPAKLDSELPELVPPRHSEDTPHIPYKGVQFSEEEMVKRTKEFYELMNKRRSVRHYSSKSVPKEVVENIIRTAGKCAYS